MASSRYYVNRDTLFSYHKASEVFLQRLMALYVASHYKVVIAKLCVNSKDISFLRQGSLYETHWFLVCLGPISAALPSPVVSLLPSPVVFAELARRHPARHYGEIVRDDWGRVSRSPMSAGSFSGTAAGNRENP